MSRKWKSFILYAHLSLHYNINGIINRRRRRHHDLLNIPTRTNEKKNRPIHKSKVQTDVFTPIDYTLY